MASSKDRQRKLARAKLDRQMARQAERERRRRRVVAGVGAVLAIVVIAVGGAWIGGAFDGSKPDTAAQEQCAWTPQSATDNTSLKNVGTPPTDNIPTTGSETMTIATNQGAPIVVGLDLTDATCSSADLKYLASKKFYDNTDCHEITTDGAIRCGDPTGTGQGGPTYSLYSENLPSAPTPSASTGTAPAKTAPLYPKGTVALIGDPPGTNGSQFLIFFKDYSPSTPQYPIVGQVTSGLDTVTAMGKIPTVADAGGDKVKPSKKITIRTLTVSDPVPATVPSASASAQS